MPNNETTAPLPGRTARSILGLGRTRNRTEQRTLMAEVDSYLSDTQEGTGSISYWQVGLDYSSMTAFLDTALTRRTKTGTQQSTSWL
jgi:hypothetical protein